MGGSTGLSQEQLLALDRIGNLPQAKSIHAGTGTIALEFVT